MISERQERISMLGRINRGRRAAPVFLADLSEALGETVEAAVLMPLPETDVIWQTFRAGYHSVIEKKLVGYRRFFLPSEWRSVFQFAECLADRLAPENAFLLTKFSEHCGAVSLNLSLLLKHTPSIICLDGDSLAALSGDRTQGILIDHNEGDAEEAFEIVVWGDRWLPLVLECDQASR